jgi:hypothetical protein
MQRQSFGYFAQLTPGKDEIEILIRPQRPMRIVYVPRGFGEFGVVGFWPPPCSRWPAAASPISQASQKADRSAVITNQADI